MSVRNRFAAALGAAVVASAGLVVLASPSAVAVAPTGGCATFFASGGDIESTTPPTSYLGSPNGPWSDEANTEVPPNYELTSSGGTLVGETRNFALTYDKGMLSFAPAEGTAYWYFSVNGTNLPAITTELEMPAGVVDNGDTVSGSFTITSGGTNTIVFRKMIFVATAGVRVVCNGQEGNTTAVNPQTTPVDTNITTSFNAFAQANATITGITNQTVTNAARAGDVISFSASAFSAAGAGTAELCEADGSACHAADSSFTVAADGTGSGTITVPAGFVGNKALKLSSGGEAGLRPIRILGTATISANIAGGGAGTVVTLTGTNWDPGQPVQLSGHREGPPFPPPATGDTPVTVTAAPNGTFTGQFTVNDANTKYLGAQHTHRVPPAAAAVFASTAFSFSGDSCTAKQGAAATGTCSLLETVTLAVTAGDLTMSKDPGSVVLDGVTLNGSAQTSTGSLRDVTVKDYRGGTLGWSLTGKFSGLTGPATIAPDKLSWTPACTAAANNDDTLVVGGRASFADDDTALPLCSVTDGLGADGVSGGDTTADAGLSLDLVPNQAAGNYTGTLTLTLA